MAASLALCLFLVSTLLTAATAKHATHAGHDNTTHQQTWCGWSCAAGQAVQAPSLEPALAFSPVSTTEPFRPNNSSLLLTVPPQSRAPPHTFFSRFSK